MQVAAGMMAGCLPAGSCAARIMLFAGGPPTIGSGKVVDMELTEPIRYSLPSYLLCLASYPFHTIAEDVTDSLLARDPARRIYCTEFNLSHVLLSSYDPS